MKTLLVFLFIFLYLVDFIQCKEDTKSEKLDKTTKLGNSTEESPSETYHIPQYVSPDSDYYRSPNQYDPLDVPPHHDVPPHTDHNNFKSTNPNIPSNIAPQQPVPPPNTNLNDFKSSNQYVPSDTAHQVSSDGDSYHYETPNRHPPADIPAQYVPPIYNSLYPVKADQKVHDQYPDYEYDNTINLSHNIPGIPGKDYPAFSVIPPTNFRCHDVGVGFYADVDTGCQVWHYCQPDGRHDAFLCPNGTIFDQRNRVCNWWYNVDCKESQYWYAINDDLYRIPKKHYPQEAKQYIEQQYLPSKRIEVKSKPKIVATPATAENPPKIHRAVIVKIPKSYLLTKDKLRKVSTPTHPKAIPRYHTKNDRRV